MIKCDKIMNLDKIISEEFKGILNESQVYQDNALNFKEQINNSTFINYDVVGGAFNPNIIESNIVFNWKLSFWINEYGIENMIIDIVGLSGEFVVDLYDKHSDELKQTNNKDINIVEWKYDIQNANLMRGGSLYITSANFDFKNNLCTINF